MKAGIYKLINPTGKVYIGESGNIDKRWSSYACLDVKKQPKLYDSLLNYGWENHQKEKLEFIDDPEIRKQREVQYIELYDSYNTGLNSTKKKRGPSHLSIESRNKISKVHKGRKKPMTSEKLKGKSKPPRTKEHCDKISKALKGYKQTEQHKLNKSKAMKGKSVTSKYVLQYDLQGNFIKEWNSTKSACLYYSGKDMNGVSACCLGKQKTAFGYIWKFKKKPPHIISGLEERY
jgi:group I intron endonuclease